MSRGAPADRAAAAAEAIEAVRRRLEDELRELNEAGLCGCGCNSALPIPRTSRLRYCHGHRDRAHKRRVRLEAEALGVPVQQSLRTLQATATTSERRRDAPAPRQRAQRRPREGASIYLRDGVLVERVLEVLGYAMVNEGQGDLEPAVQAVRKARERLARRNTPA